MSYYRNSIIKGDNFIFDFNSIKNLQNFLKMGAVCQTDKDVKATAGAAKKTDTGK